MKILLWPVKQIFFSHYVLWVNLTTPRSRMDDIESRCARMHQRIFG